MLSNVPIRFGLFVSLLFNGCAAEAPDAARNLTIAVAPLALVGVADACFDVRVGNGSDTVWSAGNPARTRTGVDQTGAGGASGAPDGDTLCASRYGNGAGGDLSYIGTCDASSDSDGNAANGVQNAVTIWVDGLYAADTTAIDDWRDPCPSGCTLQATCRENEDTLVRFDLAILRAANQGFFDVAVDFDDIFCSAKLDTCYPDADADGLDEPMRLLFGASGQRDWTAVLGLACTAGPDSADDAVETELLLGPVTVTCGATVFTLDPGGATGNRVATASPYTLHYGVYRGDEGLVCDGFDCEKRYWNLALSLTDLDLVPGPCTLSAVATARDTVSPAVPFVAGLPVGPGVLWPYVRVAATLTPDGTPVCQRHALDDGSVVTTDYAGNMEGVAAPVPMCHAFDGRTVTPTGGAGCSAGSGALGAFIAANPHSSLASGPGAIRLEFERGTLGVGEEGAIAIGWNDLALAQTPIVDGTCVAGRVCMSVTPPPGEPGPVTVTATLHGAVTTGVAVMQKRGDLVTSTAEAPIPLPAELTQVRQLFPLAGGALLGVYDLGEDPAGPALHVVSHTLAQGALVAPVIERTIGLTLAPLDGWVRLVPGTDRVVYRAAAADASGDEVLVEVDLTAQGGTNAMTVSESFGAILDYRNLTGGATVTLTNRPPPSTPSLTRTVHWRSPGASFVPIGGWEEGDPFEQAIGEGAKAIIVQVDPIVVGAAPSVLGLTYDETNIIGGSPPVAGQAPSYPPFSLAATQPLALVGGPCANATLQAKLVDLDGDGLKDLLVGATASDCTMFVDYAMGTAGTNGLGFGAPRNLVKGQSGLTDQLAGFGVEGVGTAATVTIPAWQVGPAGAEGMRPTLALQLPLFSAVNAAGMSVASAPRHAEAEPDATAAFVPSGVDFSYRGTLVRAWRDRLEEVAVPSNVAPFSVDRTDPGSRAITDVRRQSCEGGELIIATVTTAVVTARAALGGDGIQSLLAEPGEERQVLFDQDGSCLVTEGPELLSSPGVGYFYEGIECYVWPIIAPPNPGGDPQIGRVPVSLAASGLLLGPPQPYDTVGGVDLATAQMAIWETTKVVIATHDGPQLGLQVGTIDDTQGTVTFVDTQLGSWLAANVPALTPGQGKVRTDEIWRLDATHFTVRVQGPPGSGVDEVLAYSPNGYTFPGKAGLGTLRPIGSGRVDNAAGDERRPLALEVDAGGNVVGMAQLTELAGGPSWQRVGPSGSAPFGANVAASDFVSARLGDYNGDGFDDLLLPARSASGAVTGLAGFVAGFTPNQTAQVMVTSNGSGGWHPVVVAAPVIADAPPKGGGSPDTRPKSIACCK